MINFSQIHIFSLSEIVFGFDAKTFKSKEIQNQFKTEATKIVDENKNPMSLSMY